MRCCLWHFSRGLTLSLSSKKKGEPEILMGQSIVLGEVKAEPPLHNDNPMNDQKIFGSGTFNKLIRFHQMMIDGNQAVLWE